MMLKFSLLVLVVTATTVSSSGGTMRRRLQQQMMTAAPTAAPTRAQKPDTPPPDSVCTFCPEGNRLSRNTEVPGTNGTTCRVFADEAASITDPAECEDATRYNVVCCEGLSNCTLCPDGSDPQNKRLPIFTSSEIENCESYSVLTLFASEDECDSTKTLDETVDLPAYCGCDGVPEPPAVCGDFCNGTEAINRRLVTEYLGATCEEINELSKFVIDNSTCDEMFVVRPACCDGYGGCALCDRNREVRFPERVIPFDPEGVTCNELQYQLYFESDCSSINATEADLQQYCGCRGDGEGDAPGNCTLCSPGTIFANPDTFATQANANCSDLLAYSEAIEDATSDTCVQVQEAGQAYCCVEATLSPVPTPEPVSRPPVISPTLSPAPSTPTPDGTGSPAPGTDKPTPAPTKTKATGVVNTPSPTEESPSETETTPSPTTSTRTASPSTAKPTSRPRAAPKSSGIKKDVGNSRFNSLLGSGLALVVAGLA